MYIYRKTGKVLQWCHGKTFEIPWAVEKIYIFRLDKPPQYITYVVFQQWVCQGLPVPRLFSNGDNSHKYWKSGKINSVVQNQEHFVQSYFITRWESNKKCVSKSMESFREVAW